MSDARVMMQRSAAPWIGTTISFAVMSFTRSIETEFAVAVIVGLSIAAWEHFDHHGMIVASCIGAVIVALLVTVNLNVYIPAGRPISGDKFFGLSNSTGLAQYNCGAVIGQNNWSSEDQTLSGSEFESFTNDGVHQECADAVRRHGFPALVVLAITLPLIGIELNRWEKRARRKSLDWIQPSGPSV